VQVQSNLNYMFIVFFLLCQYNNRMTTCMGVTSGFILLTDQPAISL